jgi:predicted metal-dependent HD superfamily phosphohydrolase
MDRATLERLRVRWHRAMAPFGSGEKQIEQALADLIERYGNPNRHYHNLAHIAAVLGTLDFLGDVGVALEFAAWYHDAVYDSRSSDNEERSADLAQTALRELGMPPESIAEIGRLILLTKSHEVAADDDAGRRLIDGDLAILGEEPSVYDHYAEAIRREYAWVPEEAYRAGRSGVLEKFLARPRLYFLLTRAEKPARENLMRELKSLSRK